MNLLFAFILTSTHIFPNAGNVLAEPSFDSLAGTYNPFIGEIISMIDESLMETKLVRMQDFETRYSYTDSCRAAERFVYRKFQTFGLDAEFFPYNYSGNTWRNVIGTQTGISDPDKVYVICGHLDSITYDDPWNWAPGADDNASGSSAVLLAAELLSIFEFDFTIKYILFTGEEQGLHGSYYWVKDVNSGGMDIRGAINLDMIAYKDNNLNDLEFYSDGGSGSNTIADLMVENASLYSDATGYKIIDPGMWGSDHYYFWYYGYPAILGIERATDHWNPFYHSPGDIVSNCDMDLLAAATKTSIATLIQLASPDTTNNMNLQIVPLADEIEQGGTLVFQGNAVNYRGEPLAVEIWTEITLPGGGAYPGNPVIGPVQVVLDPYESIRWKLVSHEIPGSAPAGTYEYSAKAGSYPGTVIDEDGFEFTINPVFQPF